MVVTTKRMAAMARMPENSSCLLRKSEDSTPWSNAAPAGCLTSDAADRSASNRGDSLQQVSRPWIAMESLGNAAYASGQVRRRSAHRTRDSWNCFGRQAASHLGCYGEQLAGRHTNQGQELLGCFVLGLRLHRGATEVLHHGVDVDAVDGVHQAFALELALVFEFELSLLLEFSFEFRLEFALEFALEFLFEFAFELRFQFAKRNRHGFLLVDGRGAAAQPLTAR